MEPKTPKYATNQSNKGRSKLLKRKHKLYKPPTRRGLIKTNNPRNPNRVEGGRSLNC
jgi:hypothetical protein